MLIARLCAFFGVPVPAEADRLPVELPDADRGCLADYLHHVGAQLGVEVGVQAGLYAETLCQRIPGVHLYAVDPWLPYVRHEERVTEAKAEALYRSSVGLLEPYHVTIMRMTSLEAAQGFRDASLDFVYLDADHEFSAVAADLAAWVPKVRRGGVIAGHDFCRRTNPAHRVHVAEAVTGWTQAYHVAPWFVLGRKEVRTGERRDSPRSWLWINT